MGGQIGATHLRTNQKSVHVEHPLQMFAPLGGVPSNPIIPPLQIQSGASKAYPSKPAVVRAEQIAQLPADQSAVFQRMLVQHQFIPNPQMFFINHLEQTQSAYLL